MVVQNQPTLAFGWTPTWSIFILRTKNRAFLGVFTHKPGFAGCRINQNDPKWAKMGDFGNFLKNRPTGANKSSKIVSRVLFWYPGICATQIHFRSSIYVSNNGLVSFLKPKIVIFWVF